MPHIGAISSWLYISVRVTSLAVQGTVRSIVKIGSMVQGTVYKHKSIAIQDIYSNIFRDDIYVVSSIFTCLMIIGGFAAGVRILLEKGPSRHHVSEDQEIPEKYQKIIFF
jgi:hypothetical protein